jgi:hypothetical protein
MGLKKFLAYKIPKNEHSYKNGLSSIFVIFNLLLLIMSITTAVKSREQLNAVSKYNNKFLS